VTVFTRRSALDIDMTNAILSTTLTQMITPDITEERTKMDDDNSQRGSVKV